MRRQILSCLFLCAAASVASGCSGGGNEADRSFDDMKLSRDEMPHEIKVLIDAGNAAFAAGNYEAAQRHYLGAAARDTAVAAAWYGVAMAERALGNDAAADSALQRVRGLGGPAAVHHPGAGTEEDRPPPSPHGAPASPHTPEGKPEGT